MIDLRDVQVREYFLSEKHQKDFAKGADAVLFQHTIPKKTDDGLNFLFKQENVFVGQSTNATTTKVGR